MRAKQYDSIKDRLLNRRSVNENGCWIYEGARDNGYGIIHIDGKTYRTHILAYREWKGLIPTGLELDHTCHSTDNCHGGIDCEHRACFNPDHLEPVTRKENVRRGFGNSRVVENRKAHTHCFNGHEYTIENTYIYRGYRMCRKCHCETEKRRQSRLR